MLLTVLMVLMVLTAVFSQFCVTAFKQGHIFSHLPSLSHSLTVYDVPGIEEV